MGPLRKKLEYALYAGTTFVPIAPPGQSSEATLIFSSGLSVGDMLNTAFQIAINLGAILAMMRIMWAGWLYMGAADMWSHKSEAKQAFQDAIIGLLILLAIWIILHQINPDILNVGLFEQDAAAPTS